MKRFIKSLTKHSINIIIISTLGLIIGSVAVGFLVENNPIIRSFDSFGYEFITKGPHPDWLNVLIYPFDHNFLPLKDLPSYYYLMFLGTVVYLFIKKRSLVVWAFLSFLIGTLFATWITGIDWHFVFRQRPFESLPNSVDEFSKTIWRSYSSYPSGHARETTLYSTIIVNFIHKLKWPAVVFCLFIAYSRIYKGAHFPTDVIAGLLIGFISGKITLMIVKEIQIIYQKKGELSRGKIK